MSISGGTKALNSASFDQVMYEPSFYTTETYKQHNQSLANQQHYFTKDYVKTNALNDGGRLTVGVIGEDEADQIMQSYTKVSDNI